MPSKHLFFSIVFPNYSVHIYFTVAINVPCQTGNYWVTNEHKPVNFKVNIFSMIYFCLVSTVEVVYLIFPIVFWTFSHKDGFLCNPSSILGRSYHSILQKTKPQKINNILLISAMYVIIYSCCVIWMHITVAQTLNILKSLIISWCTKFTHESLKLQAGA